MTPAMDQTVRGRAITLHNAKNVYMKGCNGRICSVMDNSPDIQQKSYL